MTDNQKIEHLEIMTRSCEDAHTLDFRKMLLESPNLISFSFEGLISNTYMMHTLNGVIRMSYLVRLKITLPEYIEVQEGEFLTFFENLVEAIEFSYTLKHVELNVFVSQKVFF